MLFTSEDVPPTGTSYNFTPQVGLGWTKALQDDQRLHLGVRWFHASNARTSRINPGRDSFVLYGAISFPF